MISTNNLLEDLEYILSLSSRWLPFVKWRALPQEASELADDLVGQATTFLLERYLSSHPVTSVVSIKAHLPFSKLIQRGAEVSAIPSSLASPCLTFCERPTIDWLLLERLAHYAPAHVNCAQNYVSRVISNGGAVLVDRSADNLGRRYCVQMGAQRLSRLFRLALFGFNHGEIDLNGAFYELVQRFHLQLPASYPQLMSIHELRQHLQAFYGGWPNAGVNSLVKRLPLRVMNSSVSASLRWIESIRLPPPPHIILQTLRLLETHTHNFNLVQALSLQVRPLIDVDGRDAVFRILEVVESEIMKRIVLALCSRGLIQSAVWLHDGIWCFPIPPADMVRGCAKEALEHFGLFSEGSFLKIEPLRPKYLDLCSLLSNFSAPLLKHFTFLRRASVSSICALETTSW